MKRYLKIYIALLKYNLNRELQFRTDFWLSLFSRLAWFLMLIFFFSVIYRQTLSINGWNFYEILVLLAVFMFIETFLYTFFISNFSMMPEYISEGNLDFILLQPVDAQFFVSLKYFSLTSAINLVGPIILFVIAALNLHLDLSIPDILVFFVAMFFSIIILYNFWFLTVISLFWLTKIFSIHEVFLSLFRFMQYPSSIYHGFIRHFFSFIFPVLLTVTVPAEILIGDYGDVSMIFWLLTIAVISSVITRKVWNIGLRRYSSASS